MKRFLLMIAVLAGFSAGAQGTYEAITGSSSTNPPVLGQYNGTVGWTFTPTTAFQVVSLGALDSVITGSGTIFVGLWNAQGMLLASNAVTSSSALASDSRFEAVTPVWLLPSETYHLGAYAASGTIGFGTMDLLAGDEIFHASEINLIGSALGDSGFAFPVSNPEEIGFFYMAPNFQLTQVPEPSALSLMGLGVLTLGFLRRARRA
jgi:hypothetical protein